MKEAEKKSLIDKILKSGSDAKGARVALSVFLNQAESEDARYFLQYLDSPDSTQKKMARLIAGHFGLVEALEPLQAEIENTIGPLTFLPDAEFREAIFYSNLIEICETMFAILKSSGSGNDKLLALAEDVFKKTTNEDLRFTLIKLIGLLGDRFDFLFSLFGTMSEKEHRALYHIYTTRPHPRRNELFRTGLADEANFEFVVANVAKFAEGRMLLNEKLPGMKSSARLAALKQIQGEETSEMTPALMTLLGDENKLVVEMAADLLKNILQPRDGIEPFVVLLETGNSPDMMRAAMEIIEHLHPARSKDVLVSAIEKQPNIRPKTLIADRFLKTLKGDHSLSDALSQRMQTALLSIFNDYSTECDDLLIIATRILPLLGYASANQVKSVRKKIIEFRDRHENQIPIAVRHNFGETIAKLNQLIVRQEEAEARLKKIFMLYDIEPAKIDAERIVKLKEQLLEIEQLNEESRRQLCAYLNNSIAAGGDDWKKNSACIDLLGLYGNETELPLLTRLAGADGSLAVKVGAQKALECIRQRHRIHAPGALIAEPLPYLAKLLGDFFAVRPGLPCMYATPPNSPPWANGRFISFSSPNPSLTDRAAFSPPTWAVMPTAAGS